MCDYKTGETLKGEASVRLVEESREAGETGAVGAYLNNAGVWQWVDESDSQRTHIVYIKS